MSLKKNLAKRKEKEAAVQRGGEKRREPRVNEEAGIMVEMTRTGKFPQTQRIPVLGRNLSAGGMKIICDREFPVGARLQLKFLSRDPDQDIRMLGKVKWIKTNDDDLEVEIGVEFMNVSLLDYLQILDHIYSKKT